MKVIVDDKIPYIREALAAMGVNAVYAPGSEIDSALVRDADGLIVTSANADADIVEYARSKGKLVLDHMEGEPKEVFDNYKKFYDQL